MPLIFPELGQTAILVDLLKRENGNAYLMWWHDQAATLWN